MLFRRLTRRGRGAEAVAAEATPRPR
jgi:hypothetical protein